MLAEDEEHGAEQPVALADQREARRWRPRPGRGTPPASSSWRPRSRRPRPGRATARRRAPSTPWSPTRNAGWPSAGGSPFAGDVDEVDGEDQQDDRHEDRVRPVVHGPGPQHGAVEAQPRQQRAARPRGATVPAPPCRRPPVGSGPRLTERGDAAPRRQVTAARGRHTALPPRRARGVASAAKTSPRCPASPPDATWRSPMRRSLLAWSLLAVLRRLPLRRRTSGPTGHRAPAGLRPVVRRPAAHPVAREGRGAPRRSRARRRPAEPRRARPRSRSSARR